MYCFRSFYFCFLTQQTRRLLNRKKKKIKKNNRQNKYFNVHSPLTFSYVFWWSSSWRKQPPGCPGPPASSLSWRLWRLLHWSVNGSSTNLIRIQGDGKSHPIRSVPLLPPTVFSVEAQPRRHRAFPPHPPLVFSLDRMCSNGRKRLKSTTLCTCSGRCSDSLGLKKAAPSGATGPREGPGIRAQICGTGGAACLSDALMWLLIVVVFSITSWRGMVRGDSPYSAHRTLAFCQSWQGHHLSLLGGILSKDNPRFFKKKKK